MTIGGTLVRRMATERRLAAADRALAPAARRHRRSLPLLVAATACLLWASYGVAAAAAAVPPLPVRAVNLGGWLVVEGWIKPSPLDDAMSTNELLDGTQICIRSPSKNNAYWSAEGGGGGVIDAKRSNASSWETFKIWRRPGPDSKFRLRADRRQFVGLGEDDAASVVAAQADPNRADEFEFIRNSNRVRIRAPNGKFLQAKEMVDAVTADYGSESTSWEDSDPSVFVMEIRQQMAGEFQLCNFFGLQRAGSILKGHWESFIVEDDFRFMSSKGLNAVRIPVAWWITMAEGSPGSTSCHSPFYPGYLQMLDKAFDWATKHNLGVIVDLHAAPGSQNGNEHSGSRDGSLLWPSDDANIRRTVDAIRDLAGRYGRRDSLLAIELLNEPSRLIPLGTLGKYYRDGYRAVREHTADAYVIMSARLSGNPPEILDVIAKGGFEKYAVDVHYYNLYDDETFGSMKTLADNIRYVRQERPGQLAGMQRAGGPPALVGEWAAEWLAKNHTSVGDYGKFARAQLQVFGAAKFGWAYWTYRHDGGDPGWSLKEMMERGLVSFT